MFSEGRERTRASVSTLPVSIGGAAIGLIAGGMLTEWASWRWVMFVNVPIGVGLLVAAPSSSDETPRQNGRFDLVGAITSTLGMTSLVYGFVNAASDGWGDPTTVASFVAGALLSPFRAGRTRRSRTDHAAGDVRGPHPQRRVRGAIADDRRYDGMFFFLTQFLQDILKYTPIQTVWPSCR